MTKMKLSTAILKGSKGHKQSQVYLYSPDNNSFSALGAAYYGITGHKPRNYSVWMNSLYKLFPVLKKEKDGRDFADTVIGHNDDDGWSFKRIATWLRKLGY